MTLAALLGLGLAVPAFAVEPAAEATTAEAAQGENAGSDDPRVVGGKPVPNRKYRFIAAIRNTKNGSSVYRQQFCGGTLIDGDSVLTAAHCIRQTGVKKGDLRVTVGITTLRKGQGESRRVSRVQVHPRYKQSRGREYDAAVLTLRSPVTNVVPVRIPAATSNGFEKPGRDATVAGWGSTTRQPPSGGKPPNFPYQMREAKVPIVRDGVGKRVYGSSYVARLMVAAGREGRDTCQGDSGGPLFFSGESARFQVGITSFGEGCGARGYPGVYTEVNSPPVRGFVMNAM